MRVGQHAYPFHELSDAEFEIFSFLLLYKEHPADAVYYYAGPGDGGRDIIHEGQDKLRLIQCKRYSKALGVREVQAELAKICANVFFGEIPDRPSEVVFYVASLKLTPKAADLLRHQAKWRTVAPAALRKHLKKKPSAELLTFAHSWWPNPTYEAAVSLTERAKRFDDLRDEFFGVQKVIEGSLDDVGKLLDKKFEEHRGALAPLISPPDPFVPGATPGGKGLRPPETLEDGALRKAFAAASPALLNWPTTLGDDQWIDRPELEPIVAAVAAEEHSTALLLGDPGSGKSALLARVGRHCVEHRVPVLAIKADMLPHTIDSLAKLSEHFHFPALIGDCVRHLAATRKVVVLLDQLDALADLVDLHSGRLSVLLTLVKELSGRRNVHVLCSCRTFEHAHDIRLTSIDAQVVQLALPSWEQVEPILQARHISGAHWPSECKELLRRPQYLKVFLQRFRGASEEQIFTTYQQLFEDLWQRCVTNPEGPAGRSQLLTEMARQMAEQETLWLPLVLFEDRLPLVNVLEAADILTRSDRGLSVGFQHQTLFEHARARAFASGEGDLTGYTLSRQDGLFVRPVLWSSLNYLRAADSARYECEIQALCERDVRKHVRHLLIDFLGQVTNPPPSLTEQRLLLAFLRNPEYRHKVLASVRGSSAWFGILAGSHLPGIMRLPETDAWPMVGLLGAAWQIDRQQCIQLLSHEWMPDPAKDVLTWRTLEQLSEWDVQTLDMACTIIRRTDLNPVAVTMLATHMAERTPELAAHLIGTKLLVDLEKQEEKADPAPSPLPSDATDADRTVQKLTFRPWQRFEQLLEGSQQWYGLPALAEAAPKAFLDETWSWFVRVIEHVTDDRDNIRVSYRRDYCLATRLRNDDADEHMAPVVSAMDTAVKEFARQKPEEFLAFLEREKTRDLLSVQRLLCRGLQVVAPTYPRAALQFLVEDPRRLSLGSFDNEHADTRALISALVPHLSEAEAQELERAIRDWKRYATEGRDWDAEARFQRSKWEREHRLQLLMAFPFDRLSPATQSAARTEMTALPGYAHAGICGPVTFQWGGKTMSAQQMARAKDADIINLFAVLQDRQRVGSTDLRRGGITDAAHQFGLFAKEHPDRAVSILKHFSPEQHEHPVADVLISLPQTGYASSALFGLIEELDRRGFRSEEFRVYAARAVASRATEGNGLPDSICGLLERWLDEPWSTAKDENVRTEHEPSGGRLHSVLWHQGDMIPVPFGAYELLHALTYGYLLRKPPAAARWLDALEAHVDRPESTDAWRVLAHDLEYLHLCEHRRAARFLERVFQRFPAVRDSRYGAALLTHAWSFLPPEILYAFLHAMRDSTWGLGPQTYGELLALRAIVFAEDSAAQHELNGALDPDAAFTAKLSSIRTGLAFAAAYLWPTSLHRHRATEVLARLIPLADEHVGYAITHAFLAADVLLADAATRRVLGLLLAHPHVLKATEDVFLVERLEDVLTAEPDLVLGICREVVRLRASDLTSHQKGFAANTSHLTNIALTLQRLGGKYRAKGLELFEQLLELGVYDAQATLNELDKRTLPVSQPRPFIPRRRRKKP